jgi:hypothetical protein
MFSKNAILKGEKGGGGLHKRRFKKSKGHVGSKT